MAYNKSDELKKQIRSLSGTQNFLRFMRLFFVVYSLICLLFWFLGSFEFDWLYLFNWLFAVPYAAVRMVYRHSGIGTDFSLAIIGLISLLTGIVFSFPLNGIKKKLAELHVQLDKIIEQKKSVKRKAAKPIEGGSREFPNMRAIMPDMIQEDSILFVFIINPHVYKIKNSAEDSDFTFEETEQWRSRVNKKILENIKYTQNARPMQKGYYRKNLFLLYKDFNYIDAFLYFLTPELESSVMEYQNAGVLVQYSIVFSAITQLSALETELDLMDTILSLHFVDNYILTSSFKKAYEIMEVKKHTPQLKGQYNLSKNLSISNIQPLYEFTDYKKGS